MKPRDKSDIRNLIWKHNSYLGHCMMMKKQLFSIIEAETTTEETKRKAEVILPYIGELEALLKTRKDQK